MFEKGLLDEMKSLTDRGLTRENQSMQAIGYRELFDYFDGVKTLDETKELIKQNSRRYAKRQLTWFRRERGVMWINYPDFEWSKEKILDYIENKIRNDRK
jgi:tRNA dimethylallyltransferase